LSRAYSITSIGEFLMWYSREKMSQPT